jgi:signal transduction histidine kinase
LPVRATGQGLRPVGNRLPEDFHMSVEPGHKALEKKLTNLEKTVLDLKRAERERLLQQRTSSASWDLARFIDADYKTLCDRVLTEILDMTDSRFAFYGFLDKNESVMTIHSWSEGVFEECRVSDQPLHFPIAKAGLWAKSIRERNAIFVNDYAAGQSDKKGFPQGHVKITRVLSVPIFSRNRIVAVAAVANKTSDYVTDDAERIKALATTVQILLERRQAEETKRKLESQLMQAQKMDALGTMAGGIAHDFNNILSGILLNTEMAYDDAHGMSEIRESLSQALEAGQRAKELVGRILTFSRKVEFEKKPVDVSVVINETLGMIRSMIPSTIIIQQDVSEQPAIILADSTQLQQLVINLCTNAAHAMREKGGILEVGVKEVGDDDLPVDKSIAPGTYVKITVKDSGHGMSADEKERIFDPFFTTKQPGDGTGLGLSIVLGIVADHGGAVMIESEKDLGTICEVYFPRKDGMTQPAEEKNSPIPTGNERILYVDDEESLADASRRMIERLGYSVDVATSGDQALEMFQTNADRFDLIISDKTMPYISGEQLAEMLLVIRPDIPIIICTGSGRTGLLNEEDNVGIRNYVLKPFSKRTMAEAIRNVLDHN